ncbi:MAG: hypothetical protein ABI723_06245 [Bacteroidia bacterium]
MENVSKTELRITGIEDVEFYLHPELPALNFNDTKNEWTFNIQLARHKIYHGKKKAERLKLDTVIAYKSPLENIMMASVKLTTVMETRSLKRNEVDEQYWSYLVNLSLAHCRAVFAYKTIGTALQGKTMSALSSEDTNKNVQQKLNDIWGRPTKR